MLFERPRRPEKNQQPSPPELRRPAAPRPASDNRSHRQQGNNGGQGNGGHRGGNGGQGSRGDNDQPSPWLNHPSDPTPKPSAEASFVEYLRWMRSPDQEYKDPTKVQILQMAEENANYRDRLTVLTDRTCLIAGKENCFPVRCLWRIRVGGHRGPESILLPAFDALGMPYLPSSTLRGVARNQAIRDFMAQDGLNWQQAEKKVAPYFGSLEAESSNRAGKVIFLDAYPLPQQSGKNGGLAVDMANNIWSWDAAGQQLDYSPNPNPFFSLEEATFLIGIRPTSACNSEILEKVKHWLSKGLEAGIGSQVNTGYGSLVRAGQPNSSQPFFEVEFTLKGQLIHGRQKFKNIQSPYQRDRDGKLKLDRNGKLKTETFPSAEVRPVAFKSMLRYWFRALAMGVLPTREVQNQEARLFGGISPRQQRGWVMVQVADGRVVQREARPNFEGKSDPYGKQIGRLMLSLSSEAPDAQKQATEELLRNLTWMMFHLGGLGQGARRPCYSRKTRDRAPWWRGSTLIAESQADFWELPESAQNFQKLFQQRLRAFYKALQQIADRPVNPNAPLAVGRISRDRWIEAVDANCRIVVCAGPEVFGKPHALAILHSQDLKVRNHRGEMDYDGNLCGQVKRRDVKPSPVWIADLGDYQVVTVFGATQAPRQNYLETLQRQTSRNDFARIWPVN